MSERGKFQKRLIIAIDWHEADKRLLARMQSERQFFMPAEVARVEDELQTWMGIIKYTIPAFEFYNDEAARMRKLISQLQSA